MTNPAFLRHYAAVLIREAELRQGDDEFCQFLLAGAERAQRQADNYKPDQGDLFATMQEGNQ